MKSLHTCAPRIAGFTLIEVLVVTGIFTILAALGLFMSLDTYRGVSFRSERDVIVSILERVRSQAINNVYEKAHGVCYDDTNHQYVMFRGNTYSSGASTNITVPASSAVQIPDFPLCRSASWVIFDQLTGKLNPPTNGLAITVTQNSRISTIAINNEGRINW